MLLRDQRECGKGEWEGMLTMASWPIHRFFKAFIIHLTAKWNLRCYLEIECKLLLFHGDKYTGSAKCNRLISSQGQNLSICLVHFYRAFGTTRMVTTHAIVMWLPGNVWHCWVNLHHPNWNLVHVPASPHNNQWVLHSPWSILANLPTKKWIQSVLSIMRQLIGSSVGVCRWPTVRDFGWIRLVNWIFPIWLGTTNLVINFWVCMMVLNRTSSNLTTARGWDLAWLNKSVPCSAGWFGDRLQQSLGQCWWEDTLKLSTHMSQQIGSFVMSNCEIFMFDFVKTAL